MVNYRPSYFAIIYPFFNRKCFYEIQFAFGSLAGFSKNSHSKSKTITVDMYGILTKVSLKEYHFLVRRVKQKALMRN